MRRLAVGALAWVLVTEGNKGGRWIVEPGFGDIGLGWNIWTGARVETRSGCRKTRIGSVDEPHSKKPPFIILDCQFWIDRKQPVMAVWESMKKWNPTHRVSGIVLALILSLAAGMSRAAEGEAPHRIFDRSGAFVSLDAHLSLLSDITDWSLLAGTFGYGARGGYRFRGWGFFVQCEHNMWLATEQGSDVVKGAVNIGVGADVLYAWGFVRTSLALGPSILAFDTVLDDAGEVGVFLDLRPVGLRWPVHEMFTIGFDPITFALVAPVLGGIPLIYTQYRTVLYLEVTL